MKLLIKQRVFSWSDTYDVYDENGNPKYFVKNEIFALLHKSMSVICRATRLE